MEKEVNEPAKKVINILKDLPPDFSKAKTVLDRLQLSSAALSYIALNIAGECFSECYPLFENNEPFQGDRLCAYLPDIIQLLLSYGMDPNEILDDENITYDLHYINFKDSAAKALKMLLENGGNPNIIVEGTSLFDDVTFEIGYDKYNEKSLFKFWIVLMAYGGCWKDGEIPLTMAEGYSVDIFKDYNNFNYSIEMLEQVPGYYGCWVMHIFESDTGIEVARYK